MNECVTVSQMLSDYIIARFDRRGRTFVTRFNTIRAHTEFYCFVESENTAASCFLIWLVACLQAFFSYDCIAFSSR